MPLSLNRLAYLAGLFVFVTGLAVLVGFQTKIVGWALALFCIFTGAVFHSGTVAVPGWPDAALGWINALNGIMLMKNFTLAGAYILLATAPVDQSYWINTFLSVLIMPLAMNWSYPAGSVLMSNAVPRENLGIAASLISTMVNYSISLGLGMAGLIICSGCNVWVGHRSDHGHKCLALAFPDKTLELAG